MRTHDRASSALRLLAIGVVGALTACQAAATVPAPQTSAAPAAVATLPPAPVSTTTPATASPASSATSTPATPSGSAAVIALGKKVFETAGPVGKGCQECHGPDGKGSRATDGTQAPNIRGADEKKLRAALAGSSALMTNIKLSDAEIEAVIVYLQSLD